MFECVKKARLACLGHVYTCQVFAVQFAVIRHLEEGKKRLREKTTYLVLGASSCLQASLALASNWKRHVYHEGYVRPWHCFAG